MGKVAIHVCTRLLAFCVLGFVHLFSIAGGTVAVVPNQPWYQASTNAGQGQWARSPSLAQASAIARYVAEKPLSGDTQACHFVITASAGMIGDSYVMNLLTSFSSNPNYTCTAETNTSPAYMGMSTTMGGACPSNAEGVGIPFPSACTCKGGFKADGTATSCVPDCTEGVTVSSGFYDYGTNPAGQPPLLGCKGACEAVFDGTSPAGTTIEAGVKHYYAKGAYVATGAACSAGVAPIVLGEGTLEKPRDSCGANQAKGSVNGKTVCVDQSPPKTGEQTEASKGKTETTSSETTTTNPDGSITVKKTTVTTSPDGGKETSVDSKTTNPDGSVTTSKTVTPYKPPGDGPPDAEKGACEKNSSGEGCGGAAALIGGIYTGKDKTIAGVLTAQSAAIAASPVGSAVSGFFNVSGGGGCPTFSKSIAYFNTTLTIDQFCSSFASEAFAIFRVALMLAASFFAFRVAIE